VESPFRDHSRKLRARTITLNRLLILERAFPVEAS
jgi:hypothetical protein